MKRKFFLFIILLMFCVYFVDVYPVSAEPTSNEKFVRVSRDLFLGKEYINKAYSYPPERIIGEINVLVIFVEFSDVKASISPMDFANTQLKGIRFYYSQASYGQVWIWWYSIWDGLWFNLSNTMAYYGAGEEKSYELVRDVLSIADPYFDYKQFKYILIVHAGDDEAITGNDADIWSFALVGSYWSTQDGFLQLNIAVVAETDYMGVIAHELGHAFWLPDLYDVNYQYEYIGHWGLMAAGSYNGPISNPGSSPAQPMGWCKLVLGWIEEQGILVLNRGFNNEVNISSLETPVGIKLIKIPIGPRQYYLIEVREKTGFDQYLPDEGVLITFVDENLDSGRGIVKIKDSTPGDGDVDNGAFHLGNRFYDSNNDLVIEVVASYDSGYKLKISYRSVSTITVHPLELEPGDILYINIHNQYRINYIYVYLESYWLTLYPALGSYSVYMKIPIPDVNPGLYTLNIIIFDETGYFNTSSTITILEKKYSIEKTIEMLNITNSKVENISANIEGIDLELSDINTKLSDVNINFDYLKTKIDNLISSVNLIVTSLDQIRTLISTQLTSISGILNEIKSSISAISQDANNIKNSLNSISANTEKISKDLKDTRDTIYQSIKSNTDALSKQINTSTYISGGLLSLIAGLVVVSLFRKR